MSPPVYSYASSNPSSISSSLSSGPRSSLAGATRSSRKLTVVRRRKQAKEARKRPMYPVQPCSVPKTRIAPWRARGETTKTKTTRTKRTAAAATV